MSVFSQTVVLYIKIVKISFYRSICLLKPHTVLSGSNDDVVLWVS